MFAGFLYVLLFMSILGLGIWQSFESSYTDAKIKTNEDRLVNIEEQMNIADEVNNDSLTDISIHLIKKFVSYGTLVIKEIKLIYLNY